MNRIAVSRRLAVVAVVVVGGLTGCGDSTPAAANKGGAAAIAPGEVKHDAKTGKPASGRPTIGIGKSGE